MLFCYSLCLENDLWPSFVLAHVNTSPELLHTHPPDSDQIYHLCKSFLSLSQSYLPQEPNDLHIPHSFMSLVPDTMAWHLGGTQWMFVSECMNDHRSMIIRWLRRKVDSQGDGSLEWRKQQNNVQKVPSTLNVPFPSLTHTKKERWFCTPFFLVVELGFFFWPWLSISSWLHTCIFSHCPLAMWGDVEK